MDEQEISPPPVEEAGDRAAGQPDYPALARLAQADLANARRRFDEERLRIVTAANEALVAELIPVLDNFKRATDQVPPGLEGNGWIVGALHIRGQLQDVLSQFGVKEIEVKPGDPFDAATQEALGSAPDDSAPEGTVLTVHSTGYRLRGKLVKPATVTVSSGKNHHA